MRKLMLLALSVLTMMTMAVSPAFADDGDGDGWDEDFGFWVLAPVFVEYYDDDFDYGDYFNYGDDFDFDDYFFGDLVVEELEYEDGEWDVEFEEA